MKKYITIINGETTLKMENKGLQMDTGSPESCKDRHYRVIIKLPGWFEHVVLFGDVEGYKTFSSELGRAIVSGRSRRIIAYDLPF
ncbi:MAG: hypothetical protein JWO03_914 [Bacteroidetes bacterium]|nr:hypothetical protein [Bacteroidota bacterium]